MKWHVAGWAAIFCVCSLVATCRSKAHDLWIVPPSGPSPVGTPLAVQIAVGMDFPRSTHAASPERLAVAVYRPGGESPSDDESPQVHQDEAATATSARFKPTEPGPWLVTVVTRPNRIELSAADFNLYLLHDGLPHVLQSRMEQNETGMGATEQYTKFAKGIVAVDGAADGAAPTQRIGMTLEIVPEKNPLQCPVGDTLPVRVYFADQPLARANLCWDCSGNGTGFSGQTWTDADGRALVPIAATGLQTLRLIHMTRPKDPKYEYESFWASYTWDLVSSGGE